MYINIITYGYRKINTKIFNGGGRENRILLVTIRARERRSPLLPPIIKYSSLLPGIKFHRHLLRMLFPPGHDSLITVNST